MTTPTIEEAKINMEAAARILVGSFTSEVLTFQSLAVLKRAIKELDEARAQQPDTRPSSPIADRLADALKALLEEANAYASLMPASEEGSPSGEAEAILAEYDAQRSSAEGWVSVEERFPDVICQSCWTVQAWSQVPKQPVTALAQCPECGTAGNFRNIKLPYPPKGVTT